MRTITADGIVNGIVITPTIAGTGRTISATDGIVTTASASSTFAVTDGVTKFKVTQTGTTTDLLGSYAAGSSPHVRVTAQDADGNTVTSYAVWCI